MTLKVCFPLIIVLMLLGCGADEEAAHELNSEKTPRVTLKKMPVDDDTKNSEYVVAFKVVSDIAPKNDLLVYIFDAERVHHTHEKNRSSA